MLLTPYQRLIRLLLPEKRDIFNLYIFAFFGGLITLILPLAIQSVISFTATGHLVASWWVLIAVVVFAASLLGALKIIQVVMVESLQQKIFVKASLEFGYRLPRIEKDEDNISPTSDSNKFFEILTLQKTLPKILIDIATTFFEIIFALVLLSFYHYVFAVFSFLLVLSVFLLVRLFMPWGLKSSLSESKEKYKVVEKLQRIDLKKTPDEEDLASIDKYTGRYIEARKDHFKALKYQSVLFVVLKVLVTGGLLLIGGNLVVSNQINLGQFVAAEILIILVISAAEKLILSLESVYDALTAVEKLGQITDKELIS